MKGKKRKVQDFSIKRRDVARRKAQRSVQCFDERSQRQAPRRSEMLNKWSNTSTRSSRFRLNSASFETTDHSVGSLLGQSSELQDMLHIATGQKPLDENVKDVRSVQDYQNRRRKKQQERKRVEREIHSLDQEWEQLAPLMMRNEEKHSAKQTTSEHDSVVRNLSIGSSNLPIKKKAIYSTSYKKPTSAQQQCPQNELREQLFCKNKIPSEETCIAYHTFVSGVLQSAARVEKDSISESYFKNGAKLLSEFSSDADLALQQRSVVIIRVLARDCFPLRAACVIVSLNMLNQINQRFLPYSASMCSNGALCERCFKLVVCSPQYLEYMRVGLLYCSLLRHLYVIALQEFDALLPLTHHDALSHTSPLWSSQSISEPLVFLRTFFMATQLCEQAEGGYYKNQECDLQFLSHKGIFLSFRTLGHSLNEFFLGKTASVPENLSNAQIDMTSHLPHVCTSIEGESNLSFMIQRPQALVQYAPRTQFCEEFGLNESCEKSKKKRLRKGMKRYRQEHRVLAHLTRTTYEEKRQIEEDNRDKKYKEILSELQQQQHVLKTIDLHKALAKKKKNK